MVTKDRSVEFQTLQIRARMAAADVSELRITAKVRYSDVAYAPAALKRKIDVAGRKADRAANRLYTWLRAHSPRDWSQGIPCRWIIESLSYSDAITHGQLAVVPPAAWGYTNQDAITFSWPVKGCKLIGCDLR